MLFGTFILGTSEVELNCTKIVCLSCYFEDVLCYSTSKV